MRSTRRQFVQSVGLTFASAGALVALGLTGCRRLEEQIADLALGDEDGAISVPHGDSIDEVAHLLNRVSFGPRPGDRALIEQSGVDAYLAAQLQPSVIDDTRCDWRAAAIEPLSEARAELYEFAPEEILIALGRSRVVRSVHSKRQLLEVMVELWCDHFNIVVQKGECKWMRVADEFEVIRPNALGSFRELVRASATSPAMLIYLDGHDNKVAQPGDRPNENYARELLELHTLGVDGGYTQRDVFEAARCLSGWTYGHDFWRGRVSEVAFDPKRHDSSAKEVLGVEIPAGGGKDDIERLLDIVCFHPSTATHVARRMCRTFVADPAPRSIVTTVADVFTSSRGDIRSSLKALFASTEFGASRGVLLKRPFRYVVSALRGTAAETDGGVAILDALRRMGHAPSEYPTPDGYPLEAEPWMGSLFWRWNFAADLTRGAIDGTRVNATELVKRCGNQTAAIAHLFGRAPTERERDAILAVSDPLALALAAPAFQWH